MTGGSGTLTPAQRLLLLVGLALALCAVAEVTAAQAEALQALAGVCALTSCVGLMVTALAAWMK